MNINVYQNLADKSSHFDGFNIDTRAQLDDLIEIWSKKDNDKKTIFRGVPEAKFKLYNSAQRAWMTDELNILGSSYKDFILSEIENAKTFQNNLLQKFYNAFGHPAYDFSILSFLQHYKAPTPLLDFTYNFDSALFFGTDGLRQWPSTDIDNYFSIYAIDTQSREFTSLLDHIEQNTRAIDSLLDSYEGDNREIGTENVLPPIETLSYSHFESLQLFYVPGYTDSGVHFTLKNRPQFKLFFNQHNLNIINQEGLFVFHSDPTHPLEDYFLGYGTYLQEDRTFTHPFHLPKIQCWNIHKALAEYVVSYLNEKTPIPINKEFIYPQEEAIALSAFQKFKQLK